MAGVAWLLGAWVSAAPIRANARNLPLADESVDLIITSPPYFALRSYRDGGEHYDGQVGSEPTPQAFLEALWEVTKECWRVLKPTGSLFVNLGDKRSGSGGHNNSQLSKKATLGQNWRVLEREVEAVKATRRNAPDRYNQAAFGRPKSKMLLPHRYAIGCEDGLADPDGVGWIVRQDIVWSKPNGLPESVTDRVRDSHEYWFHLTKQGRYFSAVDEVREGYAEGTAARYAAGYVANRREAAGIHNQGVTRSKAAGEWESGEITTNPLGKLPGSVWTTPSEPLKVPDYFLVHADGTITGLTEDPKVRGKEPWSAAPPDQRRPSVAMRALARMVFDRHALGIPQPQVIDLDHFAAFPSEWPRRLILGWSPSGVCVACGEGRRPVVAKEQDAQGRTTNGPRSLAQRHESPGRSVRTVESATITGYACACPDTSAPTRPAVVVDVFGGTGTVAGVARQLGRLGLSFDLSFDYSRLAQWFLRDGRRFAKSASRTDAERQGVLL